MKIKSVMLFCNGNVACFKLDGEQFNGGRTTDKKYMKKLYKNIDKHTRISIVNWGNCMMTISKESIKLMWGIKEK